VRRDYIHSTSAFPRILEAKSRKALSTIDLLASLKTIENRSHRVQEAQECESSCGRLGTSPSVLSPVTCIYCIIYCIFLLTFHVPSAISF
jgi:hypothetical protein